MVSNGPDVLRNINDVLVVCGQVQYTHPFGIFYGDNPLQFSFPLVILEISIVITITHIVRFLLKPFKQPKIVSNVIGGILIGPSALGRNKKFASHVFPQNATYLMKNIGVIGFMYFLFLSGVKMDITQVRRSGKKQWCLAMIGIIVPILVSLTIALSIRDSLEKELAKGSSIWGIVSSLAITAFPVLYTIIRELNLLSSDIGRLALSTAVIGDVIGMNGVVAFEAAKQEEGKRIAALWYMISLVVVTVSIVGGLHQAMLWIVRNTPVGKPVDQIYVIAILVGVLVVGFVADMCGLALANGPLWLGLAVPDGPPLGATLVEKTETFVSEVLMPFAYTYVGLVTDVTSMSEKWMLLRPIFFIAFAAYMSKLVSTFVVTRFFNMPYRDGIALSLISSFRGEVEILLFMHWMDLKMITTPYFTMMVLLSVMITATFTPLLSVVYDPTRPYMVNKQRNIQHNPPNAELHIVACIHDEQNVVGFINLLESSNPNINSPFSIYVIRLIELVGRANALFLDHEIQDQAFEYTSYNPIHNAFKLLQELYGEDVMKMHPFSSVSPKRSMYQDICVLALLKKASLIILPYRNESGGQSINMQVLSHAPCSVAVLLDRGNTRSHLTHSMRDLKRSFCMLFLGGSDAREALAYADRMAASTNVSLSVVRFLSLNGNGDDEVEKKIDDGLVTWFWVKNEGNEKVVYREVVVKNGEETLAAIKAMHENNYDLWIVGRKNGINPILLQGLTDWSDNNELGVIGEYVAALETGDNVASTSVLAIQQQVLRGDRSSNSLIARFLRCIGYKF